MDNQNLSEVELLYIINKHQLSDLIFIDEEMNFLKNLLDKYFTTLLIDNHVNRVQLINNQLLQLSLLKVNVTKDVLLHQSHLHEKINDLSDISAEFLKLENDRIDDEIKDINKCFRRHKKEIFMLYKTLSEQHHNKAD